MISRIKHLLLIMGLTKGIYASWKNRRKVIFTPILNKLTSLLESVALMGLSFYETFIKQLLKIKDKYIENNQIELVEYIYNALIKALAEWKNAEPNLNNTILANIEQTTNGEIPETKKWNKDVQEQAFTRLFLNNIIREKNK